MALSPGRISIRRVKGGAPEAGAQAVPWRDLEKIHLISDAHGNPLDFLISPGQAHESKLLAIRGA
jgi:hypothetical protein